MFFLNLSLIFVFFLTFNIQSMIERIIPNSKHILTLEQFKELSLYSHNYLINYQDRLACQKNESGFVRFNIPAPKNFNHNIEKIRLNFWPNKKIAHIDPETIHNHPRYFESIIIHGGYTHATYKKINTENSIEYDQYRIFKDNYNQKKMMFMNRVSLVFLQENHIKNRSIITFPISLIHRVIKTNPSTLTLNVVFKSNNPEIYYDVFISKDGNIKNIKTEREIIVDEKVYDLTYEITNLLEKFYTIKE